MYIVRANRYIYITQLLLKRNSRTSSIIGDWMNYSKIHSNICSNTHSYILPCMAILAAFLLSGFASGQDTQDFLEGGYVGYSRTDDPGLAGMLRWLDQPVYNYPWYTSTGGSFYSQPYSETAFTPYREYYTTTGTKPSGGIVSNPAKYDISGKTPSVVYYGAGVGLPYSQYASLAPPRTGDLWIQGANNWTQYVVCPVGTWLQLVANAPAGGSAGFYEVVQTDTASTKYMIYQFNAGYNSMNYMADKVGRHMLYFVLKNQPRNVVVVDVFSQAPTISGSSGVTTYPVTTQRTVPVNPLGEGGNSGSFKTGKSSSLTSEGIATTTTTTTTSDGRTITTTNGVTTITPSGQTVLTSDGTYQTTTSPDGTQTTTSFPQGTTLTTSGDGQTTTTGSGWI